VQWWRIVCGCRDCCEALNPKIRCYPVEPVTADDTRQSFLKGERVSIPPPPTIADGLRVQIPGKLTFPIVQQLADDVLTVSDEEIIETLRFMLFRMKILVETSGVTAAAAVMFHKLPADVKRVGVILSGGNIDPDLLQSVINP
jgi:threonine dehydratase